MKVFAYSKKDNHKIAELNNITSAYYEKDKKRLILEDRDNNRTFFDIRNVKVTLHQN